MKMRKLHSVFYALLAGFLTAFALWIVLCCRGIKPVLLSASDEAVTHAQSLMDAVCSGDFAEAEKMLLETPDLGIDRLPEDPVGVMIWETYQNSLDYELVGELYATDQGVAQKVKLISIELPSVTRSLGSRAKALLDEAIASAEDVSALYDRNNEFREDLVMGILQEACRQALEEDVRYTYQIFPLQLVYHDGQWWGVADQVFLYAVSGGIAGQE